MNHTPTLYKNTSAFSFSADRCVCLIPIMAWSVFAYGWRALIITLVSVFFAVAVYIGITFAVKRRPAVYVAFDVVVSAAVFSFTLPVSVPYYIPMLGGALAAIPSLWKPESRKVFFGGFFSAAAVRLLFPALLDRATQAFEYLSPFIFSPAEKDINSIRTYTPLQLLAEGKVSSGTLLDQLYGTISGNIGEISVILLIAGGVFLLARRKMRWQAAVSLLLTVGLVTLLFPKGDSEAVFFMLVSILSGGVFLGAVFACSDDLSLPVTDTGKIVFGIGAGLITLAVRYFTDSDEGIYAAVVIMGLLTPIIDRHTLPVAYGRTKIKGGKK